MVFLQTIWFFKLCLVMTLYIFFSWCCKLLSEMIFLVPRLYSIVLILNRQHPASYKFVSDLFNSMVLNFVLIKFYMILFFFLCCKYKWIFRFKFILKSGRCFLKICYMKILTNAILIKGIHIKWFLKIQFI